MYMGRREFSELLGKTLTKIDKTDEEIIFHCDSGEVYRMYHNQDCCESVRVEDVTGDINDLIGEPILRADTSRSNENPDGIKQGYQESFTWTFYKLATVNGWVDIRWYGESNGFYSEEVDFVMVEA